MATDVASFRAAVDAMKVEVVAIPVPQLFRLLDEVEDAQRAVRTLGVIRSAMEPPASTTSAAA